MSNNRGGSGRLKSADDEDTEESSSLRPPTRRGSTPSQAAPARGNSDDPLPSLTPPSHSSYSTEYATGASYVGDIERGAHRLGEEQEQVLGVEEAAIVAAKTSEDAAAADEDCFDADFEGEDSAFVAHAAEAFPFEGASQAARSDAREADEAVGVVKKSLGTHAMLDGGVESNQQGEETLNQVPSAPRSRSPQQEGISLVMEEAKEEEEEFDMYDVRAQESTQTEVILTPPSPRAGRETASNPGAFAVQGQTIEQRTLGMLSPIPEPEQTGLPSVTGIPPQPPVDESTSQIPIAATVASDQLAEEVRRTLAQTTVVAETVPATDRKWWKRPAVLTIVAFLLVATIVGVTVGLLLSRDDGNSDDNSIDPGVAGDSCASSIPLETNGALIFGSTVGATFDNVTRCGATNSDPGVWYVFLGTGELLTATTCFTGLGSNIELDFDTKISVYSRSCNNLVCVDGNDDSSCGIQSSLTWESVSGEQYYILIHGSGGTGTFALSIGAGIACESAVGPLPLDGSVTLGSTENGAVAYNHTSCGPTISSLGVWYKVVGTGDLLTATTCFAKLEFDFDPDFDTKISVFSGSCNNLACIAGNDDSLCGIQSSVTWEAALGEEYYMLVHGSGETGDFALSVGTGIACESAVGPLPLDGSVTLGSTENGAVAYNHTSCGPTISSLGVWYKVVGTGDLLTATTCFARLEFDFDPEFDTKISVFSGSCNNLACIAGNDDSLCGIQSSVTWEAALGEEYYILVHGSSRTGDFALSVGAGIACESAVGPLPVDGSVTIGSNVNGAMAYRSNRCGTFISSLGVWYRVNGTGGTMLASTCGNTDFDTRLSIFSGTCDSLVCVGGNDFDECGTSWNLTAGQQYFIFVHGSNDGNLGATGTFGLTVDSPYPWLQLGQDLDGDAAEDQFGYSVSLSNDATVLAAGAPENNANGNFFAGHVRVFRRDSAGSTWSQIAQELTGGAAVDRFGISVSLNGAGDILVVGAAQFGNDGPGYAQAFQYDASTDAWQLLGQQLDGSAAYDVFGNSVSLSNDGSTLAVGAPYNSNERGHVRIYRYDSSSERWSQLGNDIEGQDDGDQFGWSVSLNGAGDIVGVGADDADTPNGSSSGRVQVFQYLSAAQDWIQLGDDLDGQAADDDFGISVSLSNDGMVLGVGAHGNDENGSDAGQVRVFQYSSSELAWLQLGNPLNGEAANDQFGRSVSLNGAGNVVAAGAYLNDNASGSNSGHVRVFQYDTTEIDWIQVGGDIDGEAARDWSGESVSLSDSGSEVAIGADGNDGNGDDSGHVRVYALDPN